MSVFVLSVMTYVLLGVAGVLAVACVADRSVAVARWMWRRRPLKLPHVPRLARWVRRPIRQSR